MSDRYLHTYLSTPNMSGSATLTYAHLLHEISTYRTTNPCVVQISTSYYVNGDFPLQHTRIVLDSGQFYFCDLKMCKKPNSNSYQWGVPVSIALVDKIYIHRHTHTHIYIYIYAYYF
jgi:hypothetical protein